MAPLKSPGPDGMPPFFFQKYWHIVKTDVISATLALLNELILPLAAFVPGRLITDNVLLAFEVNHYLNTKKWGEKGHMALKLDISKAYDKIEWKFLEKVLFGSVIPQRGSVKGIPSRLTCFYCVQRLLALYCRGKRGEGCKVWRCVVEHREFHIFFSQMTPDLLSSHVDAALCILEVLDIFGRAAGQEINFTKSSVVFSRNTVASLRDEIQGILNIRVEGRHDLYLGLLSVVGKTRRSVFQSIRDRVWNRINGWNERNLSQAGKEILIKAVAQAIPTYAMGCFRLPISLIKELQSMVANFGGITARLGKLTGSAGGNSASPKFRGLGFRDLQAFNLAMLSKQLWRIISKPDSYLAEFFERDISQTDMFFRHRLDEILPTRRSIQAAQQVVRGGLRWRIRSGRSVRIWGDPWIPRPFSFSVLPPNATFPDCVSVTLSMLLRRSGITVSFASCFGKKISMLSSLFPSASSMGGLSYMAPYT
ncbi:UNVERIFIED_CONTAM: hypothetical protein Scaly_2034500 [Sesamum calycinum]|uniref:Reverse transcriptase n=1 Tax=Sesamum calycinum TaxID=2727403 RepID=A0AAW2N1P1_9LAMI